MSNTFTLSDQAFIRIFELQKLPHALTTLPSLILSSKYVWWTLKLLLVNFLPPHARRPHQAPKIVSTLSQTAHSQPTLIFNAGCNTDISIAVAQHAGGLATYAQTPHVLHRTQNHATKTRFNNAVRIQLDLFPITAVTRRYLTSV